MSKKVKNISSPTIKNSDSNQNSFKQEIDKLSIPVNGTICSADGNPCSGICREVNTINQKFECSFSYNKQQKREKKGKKK